MNEIWGKYSCIKCGKEIHSIKLSPEITAIDMKMKGLKKYPPKYNLHEEAWNGGIVGKISAGFGSVLDGGMFNIAICDDCIIELTKDDMVQYAGNYMYPEIKENNEEFLKESRWDKKSY